MNNKFKFAIGIVISLGIIISIITSASSILKDEAVDNYLTISKLNAKAFSKELNQDLSNIEQTINNISLLLDLNKVDINSRLVNIQKNFPVIRSINILKNEKIKYSSNIHNIDIILNQLNLFPNPIFEDDILRISTPWIGRDFINGSDVFIYEDEISKKESYFIPISKKVKSKDGEFNIIINLNSDYFVNRFLSNIKSNKVLLELVRLDGILLLSTNPSKIIGQKIKNIELLEKTIDRNGITGIDIIEDKKYMSTYLVTDDYPIGISVKLDYEKNLMRWNKKEYNFFTITITIITIIISIFIALVLFYLYSKSRENEIRLQKEQIKAQEKSLKKNLEVLSLKSTLDNAILIANLGPWEWDVNKDITTWADITYSIYGIDKNEKINIAVIESLIVEEDLKIHREQVKKCLLEKTSFDFEYKIKKDGEIRIIKAMGKPIIHNDEVIKLSGVVQDITEIKEKEIELLEAQKIANIGHYDYNIKENTFTNSKILDDIFGIPTVYERTFDTWLALVHPEDKIMVERHFSEIIKNQDKFNLEYRIINQKTKKTKWLHGLGVFVCNKKTNEPERLFGTIQDITIRKEYEKNMQQALSVFEKSHDSIMITDRENKIINVNPSFTVTTGYLKEEVLGKNPSILKSHKSSKEFYDNMWNNIQNKGYWAGEITNKIKDGKFIQELLSISTIKIDDKTENFIAIFSDISIQKHQEKMLLQQSRTAAVGEMIGNIAHQWRQPLSVISTAATGLDMTLELNKDLPLSEIQGTLKKINYQTQHLSKTIDDFRNFFRGDMTQAKEFDLKLLLQKVEQLTIDSFRSKFIEVEKNLEDNILINVNENLLIQALINIYNNALDALKEISISKSERKFFISLKRENQKVILSLKDNAGGIKEENLEKIFEPYFTTKHESVGTGLGLYMTYQIITKQLNGKISVQNSKYKYEDKTYTGAEFIIEIG